jgi:hypothetical protein
MRGLHTFVLTNQILVIVVAITSAARARADSTTEHSPPGASPAGGCACETTPSARSPALAHITAGGYYGTRSLTYEADSATGPLAYHGVPSKGVGVAAELFPFPSENQDGWLSGVGMSVALSRSAGSTVNYDDGLLVGEYAIAQNDWNVGAHYRAPIDDDVAIDGELSYGGSSYAIRAPMSFEVPDTDYRYLGVGGHVDVKIVPAVAAGVGARYMHVLDTGNLGSFEWYGPGQGSGLHLDGNLVVRLPRSLFLRGELAYQRFAVEFDGVGAIAETMGVRSAHDATMNASLGIGVEL